MNRNILFGLAFIIAVIWLTPRLFPTPPKPASGVPLPPAATATTPGMTAGAAVPNGAGSGTTAAGVAPAGATPAATVPVAPAVRAETTTIAGPRAELRFSSQGGALVGATMKDYRSFERGSAKGQTVELARPSEPLLTYTLATPTGTVPLSSIPLTATRDASGSAVSYAGSSPAGSIALRYAIVPDSYVVRVSGTVQGAPSGTTLLVNLPSGLRSSEADTVEDASHLAIAYKRKPDDAKSVSFSRVDPGEQKTFPGPMTWAVTKSKYFLVAVAARDTAHPLGALTITGQPRTGKVVSHMAGTVQVPVTDGSFAFDVYAGPQEWKRLRALGRDLDTANPYGGWLQGIVQPFATIVMRVLLWMHGTLNVSYGVVLILFGVLIRLLTWPLNQSAMRTSLKMQRIQPELQEIQKKYRSDPQRLNAEMMRLYKEHDMSPFSSLAGCMPMLIPMPILFALFYVFRNTIEFRGVPFLWLPDLALHDPYYILPVLMGISMFTLSWIGLKGAPPNPQAKMMAYMMPAVMTFIFLRFPSGLNLYYTVQNLVTIPQQWLLSKERVKANQKPLVRTPAAATPPRGARRGSQA